MLTFPLPVVAAVLRCVVPVGRVHAWFTADFSLQPLSSQEFAPATWTAGVV